MSPRPVRRCLVGSLVLAGWVFAGPRADAQTPSSTWIATNDGLWSNGANWSPPTPPVPGATTTVLQFNAAGATTYTATNDVADPFALFGIIANSSSTNPIALAGGALSISQNGLTAAATGFISQQGSGAFTINNPLVVNNPTVSSTTGVMVGGIGSGTVTLAGTITGQGGLIVSNVGGATVVVTSGANAYGVVGTTNLTGGTQVTGVGATLLSTATSGTPFGVGGVQISAGTIAVAPTGTGADVSVGLAATRNFSLNSGGTLVLNKGGNNSLTFTANSIARTIGTGSSGNVVIAPASGIAALGTATGERFVTTVAQATTNGIVTPVIVGQASLADTTADFLTFTAGNGFSQFQGYVNYATPGGAYAATGAGTEVSNITASSTATAASNPYAMRVTNATLTINAGATVTSGTGGGQTGLILNNATIGGAGTLAFGGAEADVYVSAGTSTISSQVVSTNPSTATPALVKFGPGTLLLTNPANSFAGTTSLYGGFLAINGPGGTQTDAPALTNSAATAAIVMRGGGGFQLLTGDYNPPVNRQFVTGTGGGTFDIQGASTMTLDQGAPTTQLLTLGPIFKTGTGRFVLGADYNLGAQPVYIKQGTVLVNAATTNSGSITVFNSGTLGGTGGVSGTATVLSGGTVSPGASVGTLSLGGLTLRPGGAYQFEYNPGTASPVAGTDNDTVLATAGALDLSALSAANRFVVNLLPASSATPPGSPVTYTAGTFSTTVFPAAVPGPDVTSLFTFTGAFAGTPTAAVNGGVLTFTFTPVPEPGAVLAACAVGAAVFARRRQSNSLRVT